MQVRQLRRMLDDADPRATVLVEGTGHEADTGVLHAVQRDGYLLLTTSHDNYPCDGSCIEIAIRLPRRPQAFTYVTNVGGTDA